jgi:hypothetical protein
MPFSTPTSVYTNNPIAPMVGIWDVESIADALTSISSVKSSIFASIAELTAPTVGILLLDAC